MSMRPAKQPNCEVVAYSEKGKTVGFSVGNNQQMAFYNARAWNRSGSAINVGILRSLHSDSRKVITKVGSTYADVSAAVNAGTSTAVVTTTNNDGFIVASPKRFGFIGITVSNSATGGTYAFQYWNGSTWASLTTLENPTDLGSTGDKYIVFVPPIEWIAGNDSGLSVLNTLYSIKVVHTSAPSDAGNISAIWMGTFFELVEGVSDNAGVQINCDLPLVLDGGEGIFPYFSTANAANLFGAYYSAA